MKKTSLNILAAVTFYSTSRGRGVSYVYPEIYPGDDSSGAAAIKNSIWDRRDDNKLYFNPDVTGMNLDTGDRFSFHLEVIPFVATPAEWRDIGRGHAFGDVTSSSGNITHDCGRMFAIGSCMNLNEVEWAAASLKRVATGATTDSNLNERAQRRVHKGEPGLRARRCLRGIRIKKGTKAK